MCRHPKEVVHHQSVGGLKDHRPEGHPEGHSVVVSEGLDPLAVDPEEVGVSLR